MRSSSFFSGLVLFIILMVLPLSKQDGSGLPPNWWVNSKARGISSYQEYQTLVDTELKDKFVFIDFYMQNCYWCYVVLEDFNRLIDDMYDYYGTDKVAILKADGMAIRQLS